MVNVAGRSKACHNCRRRRVACTQEKPECSQCVRLGLACAGYSAERIFILVNNDRNTRSRKGRTQSGLGYNKAGRSSKAEAESKLGSKATHLVMTVFKRHGTLRYHHMIDSGPVYRQQLFQNFLSFYLPKGEKASECSESLTSWYTLYAGLLQPTAALDIAMMAFCTLTLSQANDDEHLLMASLRYYTYGLQALRKALRDPKLMYCDETVGATMALAMYEVTACPGNTRFGYISHVRGMARLIAARGPHAYTSLLGHGVLRMFRVIEVVIPQFTVHRLQKYRAADKV